MFRWRKICIVLDIMKIETYETDDDSSEEEEEKAERVERVERVVSNKEKKYAQCSDEEREKESIRLKI